MDNVSEERKSRLKKVLSRRKHVVIVLHDNPDPDAIASGWGLQYYLKKSFNVNSEIVYGGIIARAENRAMVDRLEIPLLQLPVLESRDNCIYALVDTQPAAGNNSLPPEITPHIVIDHHPSKHQMDVPYTHIDTDMGATTSMIYSYIKHDQYHIPKLLATAMYYGISSETQDLGREATELDQKVYTELFPLTSKKILSQITHPKNSREYFAVLAYALKHAKADDTSAYCHLGEITYPDYIHQIADILLTVENVRWSFSSGWHNNTLYVSLRSTNPRSKAGVLVRRLVGAHGKAGGHDTMAGGKLEYSVMLTDKMRANIEDLITKRFARYCSRNKNSVFRNLVSI